MRRSLSEGGVQYKVVKKTLANIALEQSGIEGEKPEFAAELAIAWGSDALAPARSVYKFQRELEDRVAIIGGVFEGAFQSQASMLEIAQIPSRETLLGMFVNVINSPVQGFVSVLDQVAEKKEANA